MQAREAVEMRAQVERKMAQKEKEKHEEKLREMAQKARERRAGIKTHVEKGTVLILLDFTLKLFQKVFCTPLNLTGV